MKKLELNLVDYEAFINFITKFKAIDKNLMLKINSEKIVAKSYTEGSKLLKYGEIDFLDIFTFTKKDSKIEEPIKLWIFNIDKFKNILNVVGNCKILLEIDDDNFVSKIELKTKELKKTVSVLNNLEFNDVTEEKINKVFDKNNSPENKILAAFNIDKQFLIKLKSLVDLDSENYFYFTVKNNKPIFVGSEFELIYDIKLENDIEEKCYIDNSIFKYLDFEDQEIIFKDYAVLFFNDNGFKFAFALSTPQ